jgi:hypothetical protein
MEFPWEKWEKEVWKNGKIKFFVGFGIACRQARALYVGPKFADEPEGAVVAGRL